VEIDISQLEASVLNLAVNARDAMPHGGRLVIEVDNSHLDHDYAALFPDATPGEYVMLRVRDNGHGIDAEARKHLFEPFFTTKPGEHGLGLGLTLSASLAAAAKGSLNVEHPATGGTAFVLALPLVSPPSESAEHP